MSQPRILLVGDSTLDNCVWVDKGESVPEQLKAMLPEATIINLAADGFTTGDVLKGNNPRISWSQRQKIGDPFPTAERAIFQPLKILKKLDASPTHIVLSCGGNDVREILGNMSQLPDRLASLSSNYRRIIAKLHRICPRAELMVMFIYRPCRNEDHYGVYAAMSALPGRASGPEKLDQLLVSVQEQFLPLLLKHKATVLDLASSFDPRDSSLFERQIEPSRLGGQIIASLIVEGVRAAGPRLLKHPIGTPAIVSEQLGQTYHLEPLPVVDTTSARAQAVATLKELGYRQADAELELVLDQVGNNIEAAVSLLNDLA